MNTHLQEPILRTYATMQETRTVCDDMASKYDLTFRETEPKSDPKIDSIALQDYAQENLNLIIARGPEEVYPLLREVTGGPKNEVLRKLGLLAYSEYLDRQDQRIARMLEGKILLAREQEGGAPKICGSNDHGICGSVSRPAAAGNFHRVMSDMQKIVLKESDRQYWAVDMSGMDPTSLPAALRVIDFA